MLIKIQNKGMRFLDYSNFHPEKDIFLEAERISDIKKNTVEILTKSYYLTCDIKGIKVTDLLCTYDYLYTLSEILYYSSLQLIDEENPETYIKEISIVDIKYLASELSRIHNFKHEYAEILVDRFVFHEKKNKDDDIFAQPLLKISKTQILLSQILLDQVNLDRVIERQFIRYNKNVADVGRIFEGIFLDKLNKGYKKGLWDISRKPIPNFKLNVNKVKYEAFDGKEIEFDVISVLGDFLILTELKAVMTSYDLTDLEKRKKNVKDAVAQLKRRAASVVNDWEKFKNLVSIELPDNAFDKEHIILVACTDAYDYTPLKDDGVFITDDSTYLKYFTAPYIEMIEESKERLTIQNIKNLWKYGYPDPQEFIEYLTNPATIHPFVDCMEKELVPIPVIDESDLLLACEDYKLFEDPIKAATKI